jgi:hypothetical protein
MLPAHADEQFTQGLVQAILQLDHVDNVNVFGRVVSVTNELVPHLKGEALTDTIIEFDSEVNDVLHGMLNLVEVEPMQAARQMTFSHR